MKDFLKRISSRKFLFWVCATVMCCQHIISGWEWLIASGIFLGTKVGEKLIETIAAKYTKGA